jgi:hypothetical protein
MRRTARGGRDSIDHAPGAHDDLANSACGALVELGTGSTSDVEGVALRRQILRFGDRVETLDGFTVVHT